MRVIFAVLAAWLSFGAAVAAEAWQAFKDPAGTFSVEFPGEPAAQQSLGSNKDGHITPPGWRYMALEGKVALVVIVTDLTSSPVDAQATFAGAVGGFGKGGTVVSDVETTVDAHAGRAIEITDAKSVSSARIFLVNDRVYQVLVMSPKAPTVEEKAAADRFAGSFHFLK